MPCEGRRAPVPLLPSQMPERPVCWPAPPAWPRRSPSKRDRRWGAKVVGKGGGKEDGSAGGGRVEDYRGVWGNGRLRSGSAHAATRSSPCCAPPSPSPSSSALPWLLSRSPSSPVLSWPLSAPRAVCGRRPPLIPLKAMHLLKAPREPFELGLAGRRRAATALVLPLDQGRRCGCGRSHGRHARAIGQVEDSSCASAGARARWLPRSRRAHLVVVAVSLHTLIRAIPLALLSTALVHVRRPRS
jgi:hypothetical protein